MEFPANLLIELLLTDGTVMNTSILVDSLKQCLDLLPNVFTITSFEGKTVETIYAGCVSKINPA